MPPPPELGIASTFVLGGLEPLRLVVHHEDGSWDFLSNSTTDLKYLQTVHAEEMFSRFSKDLAPLRSLSPGYVAERDDAGSEWLVEPYTEE